MTYTENDPITDHLYTRFGRYEVKLTVYDNEGLFNTTTKYIEISGKPTSISISLSSSTSYLQFKVEINGNLTSNGTGLSAATIFLASNIGAGWNDITSVNTASDGSYSAVWIPSATGNYIVRAEWSGNATYGGATAMVNLAVMPYEDQNVFSVTSNSTISGLAFNTTSWELSFTATGPDGTEGYTKVTVAKSLVENITNIRVYLDGNESEYTIASKDDSWLLTFTYIHSDHQVVVDLDINIIPEFPSIIILPLFMLLALIAVALAKKNRCRVKTKTTQRLNFRIETLQKK